MPGSLMSIEPPARIQQIVVLLQFRRGFASFARDLGRISMHPSTRLLLLLLLRLRRAQQRLVHRERQRQGQSRILLWAVSWHCMLAAGCLTWPWGLRPVGGAMRLSCRAATPRVRTPDWWASWEQPWGAWNILLLCAMRTLPPLRPAALLPVLSVALAVSVMLPGWLLLQQQRPLHLQFRRHPPPRLRAMVSNPCFASRRVTTAPQHCEQVASLTKQDCCSWRNGCSRRRLPHYRQPHMHLINKYPGGSCTWSSSRRSIRCETRCWSLPNPRGHHRSRLRLLCSVGVGRSELHRCCCSTCGARAQ